MHVAVDGITSVDQIAVPFPLARNRQSRFTAATPWQLECPAGVQWILQSLYVTYSPTSSFSERCVAVAMYDEQANTILFHQCAVFSRNEQLSMTLSPALDSSDVVSLGKQVTLRPLYPQMRQGYVIVVEAIGGISADILTAVLRYYEVPV